MQTMKAVEISKRICNAQKDILVIREHVCKPGAFEKEMDTLAEAIKALSVIGVHVQKVITEL